MPDRRLLDGKVAIVTGGAAGIGEAIVSRYLEEGAKLLVVDRDPVRLPSAANAAITLQLDLTEEDAPGRIRDAAIDSFGGIDILVNNAAFCVASPFEEESLERWQRTLDVNVTAPFRLARAIVPSMKARGGGRIINLGSILSDIGQPEMTSYAMSKHAIAGLSKGMAIDLAKYNILVNYIQPGVIRTPLSQRFLEDPAMRAFLEELSPLGRLGEPADVAGAAVFLAGADARYTTGTGLHVCGGAVINL